MNEINELNKFYRSAIGVADLTADSEGHISGGVFLGELKQAYVSGRRLVLPTKEQLNSQTPDSIIRIHPLKENVVKRGESQVMQALRNWATRRAYVSLTTTLTQLLTLALDNDKLPKLRPQQAEVLKHLSDVDVNAVNKLIDVIEAASDKHAEYPLLGLYVRRPGPRIGTDSRRIRRVGVMTFPLYQRLSELWTQEFGDKIKLPKGQKHVKETRAINGQAIRRVDIELFKRLFEAVIPKIADTNYWITDVDTDVGPTFIALMQTISKFAQPVSHVALLFKDVFEDADKIAYDLDWVDQVEDPKSLERLADSIPMQFGNEGAMAEESTQPPSVLADNQIKPVAVETPVAVPVATAVAPAPTQAQAPAPAPVQQHPHVKSEQPNIVLPGGLPPVARPTPPRPLTPGMINNITGASAAMMPMFGGGLGTEEPRKSLYDGNRLPTLNETAVAEQKQAVAKMLAQREQAWQQQQQHQPVQQQVQPIMGTAPLAAGPGQMIINGQIFQAVGTVAGGVTAPVAAGPLTLNHLVPPVNTAFGFNQPINTRQAPVFGQTVVAGTGLGGNFNTGGGGFGFNNGGSSLM